MWGREDCDTGTGRWAARSASAASTPSTKNQTRSLHQNEHYSTPFHRFTSGSELSSDSFISTDSTESSVQRSVLAEISPSQPHSQRRDGDDLRKIFCTSTSTVCTTPVLGIASHWAWEGGGSSSPALAADSRAGSHAAVCLKLGFVFRSGLMEIE